MQYNPNDLTTVSAECKYIKSLDLMKSWPGTSHLMIGSYKVYPKILNGKATYLPQFKDLIRHGHAIAFTGLVAKMHSVESPHADRFACSPRPTATIPRRATVR